MINSLYVSGNDDKLILTRMQGIPVSFFFSKGKLLEIDTIGTGESRLNNIYLGRIKNVASNLNAAFVELENRETGFLSLDYVDKKCLMNRDYDGKWKAGDEIVVQVAKDALKTKDAVLTTNLSFAGVYCVVTAGKKNLGFSKHITEEKKKFFKEHLASVLDGSAGVVIRTNAESLNEDTMHLLSDEIKTLRTRLQEVFALATSRPVFTALYREVSFFNKKVRDQYQTRTCDIVTDQKDVYEELQNDRAHCLTFYQDQKLPINALYGLKSGLDEALSRKVWLKSGGYLVIEPTEALTVIDVNTGKNTSKIPREELIFCCNREAAAETARQLRLRNLSGIIIVDFINMEQEEDRKKLIQILKEELAPDPVQTVVAGFTNLGLVEITRKKITDSLGNKWKNCFEEGGVS